MQSSSDNTNSLSTGESLFVGIVATLVVIFAFICLVGEIVLLVDFGSDECLTKEVRLTSLYQVFVCNIISYIFILIGALAHLVKLIMKRYGYSHCHFDGYPSILLVMPLFGFIIAGALSITEVYVFAYMAGKGVCEDPTFIQFVATTVSIKLFVLIICMGIYIWLQQESDRAVRMYDARSNNVQISNTV